MAFAQNEYQVEDKPKAIRVSAVPRSALAFKAIMHPSVLARDLIRRFHIGSFEFRMAIQACARPWYAYGVWHAADLARRLGLDEVTVVELGVAGGEGLRQMEQIAAEVEKSLAVRIHVFGFDTGYGLPPETDYRDLPYVYRRGLYRMDVERVQASLSRAQLVLGDVASTIPGFLRRAAPAPIGFVSFDLDYYSSTAAGLRILRGPDKGCLPRVLCYFDDVTSADQFYLCEDVGELNAIREFNNGSRDEKIRPAHNFMPAGSMPYSPWAEKIWVYHRFHHPQYNTYIGTGNA